MITPDACRQIGKWFIKTSPTHFVAQWLLPQGKMAYKSAADAQTICSLHTKMQDCAHCEQGEPNHAANWRHKKCCQRTHKLPYLRSEGETSAVLPKYIMAPCDPHGKYSCFELHCALSSYTCHMDYWRLQIRCLFILWKDSALADKMLCHY